MRKRVLSLIFILLCTSHRSWAAPIVVQGLADLSTVDWAAKGKITLDGDWRFFWNQLLSPEQVEQGQGQLSGYLSPEKEWQYADIPGIKIQNFGSATYHVRIYLDKPQELTLQLPILNSASRVWINQQLVQEFGRVTLNAEEALGFVSNSRVSFSAKAGENTLTIQMSNHLFSYGGASLPILIGQSNTIYQEQIQAVLKDTLSFGLILFMALYHIYLWYILKRGKSPLLFGLFCLVLALRSSVVGDGQVLQTLWPAMPMNIRYSFEYLGLSSCIFLLVGLIRDLYPQESPAKLYYPPMVLAGAWSLFILFGSPRYYARPLPLFQLIILISSFISTVTVIVACVKKREGAQLFLAGFLVFVLTVANDVALAQRFITSVPLAHYGLLMMLFSQSLILAQRFARSFDRAESAEHEVKLFNLSLEQKISERTEQINTILDHAQSGFLLIDDQSRIQTGFTKSCQNILGMRLQVGAALPEFLNFSPQLRSQFRMAVQQIFTSDMPIEVTIQQLPTRFPLKDRMIGLQAAAVRNPKSDVFTALLLTINDVTDLVAAEEGLRQSGVLIKILEDQDAFRVFLDDFKTDVDQALAAANQTNEQALHATLHSMKGNAATFQLEKVVERIHQVEDGGLASPADIQSIADVLRNFLKQHETILHMDFDQPGRRAFKLESSDFKQLQEALVPIASPSVMNRLNQWLKSMKELTIRSYTTPLGSMVTRVAKQLQKEAVLQVEGADFRVDRSYGRFLNTLSHLVRNSLVHGIEEPDLREGKPEQGTIHIQFTPTREGGLQIVVKDDGKGLDGARIRAQALQQGILTADASLNESDTFALIFHPNFSTADQVTLLAGRGMGLSAVASAVQELGGSYQVSSRKNQGTQFTFTFPPVSALSLEQAV